MGPDEARVGRRLAAIFAADVAGYSRLMGQDEAGTMRALSAARASLGRFIPEYGGRLVNTVGDSVLAEFPSAVDAVKCAIAVQARRAEADAEAVEGPRLRFRIAVHVGDVMPSGTDIFGDGINVCARLQEVAEPGGICISGAAYHYVCKTLPVAFGDLGEKTLKNIDVPVRVFAIRPQGTGHSPPRPKPSATPDLPVPPRQAKTRTLGWIAAGGVAVLAIFLLYQFAMQPATTTAQPTGVEAARADASSTAGVTSIAVLPLANLSGDVNQEFFSDGMTDEITTALTKIPNLRVVGRTSAFQFKGQNRDVRAISEALQARYVIDGSVRRVGDRVRVTAQLIQADNGVNLWADNYDRELTDVFVIQEEIAQAIASALRVPLGLRQGESLIPSRTSNLESYQDYLRAKALLRARGPREPGGPLTEAATLLEQVVARDPNYAPGWAVLAQAYALTTTYSPAIRNGAVDELRRMAAATVPRAEAAAQQAIRLDPSDADGYVALAIVQTFRGRFVEAEDLFKQALSLDPGNPEALNIHSAMVAVVGRLKDSLPMRLRLRAQEPFVPVFNVLTAGALWVNGQNNDAIALLRAVPAGTNALVIVGVAEFYASLGRHNEAADTLLQLPSGMFLPEQVEEAARLLRAAPAQRATPQTRQRLGQLGFVHLYAGAPDRALEWYEGNVDAGYLAANAALWHSSYAAVRKTERFKALMRNAGMVAYWRARGRPDLCRPIGTDDFVCD
jgi:adenylate cyclase